MQDEILCGYDHVLRRLDNAYGRSCFIEYSVPRKIEGHEAASRVAFCLCSGLTLYPHRTLALIV